MTEQLRGTDGLLRPEFTRGDHLRKALEVSGVSSKEMADLLGVSRNTVSNILHDKVPVRRQTLLVWAMRTGVSLRWLETGSYATETDDDALDQAYLIQGIPNGVRARRDSNPKPSDWESSAQVIELDARRTMAVAS